MKVASLLTRAALGRLCHVGISDLNSENLWARFSAKLACLAFLPSKMQQPQMQQPKSYLVTDHDLNYLISLRIVT